jgi:transcriptional regulator with XRE-family HTH domain
MTRSPKEIGEILKEAREKKGLAIDKVHKTTHIQPHVISALEEGTSDRILSRVYVLLFLKKYANFLDLDGQNLAASYKGFYTGDEKQVLHLDKKPQSADVETEKWAVFTVFAVAALILVFFILFLGVSLRSFYVARKKSSPAEAIKTAEIPKPEKKPQAAIFPIPKERFIDVTLAANADVWIRIKKDGKAIFEGTLRRNEKKNWSARDKIELWAGRAEAIDLTINQNPVGKVGKGNIKNIQISRTGIKVGDKWLLKPQ